MYPYNEQPQPHQNNELFGHLDKISSFLNEGFVWHKAAANACRKFAVRGWGRLHDCQADCDSDELICFEKILCDKLNYCPKFNFNRLPQYAQLTINSMDEFKNHHTVWIARESEIIPTLNAAIHLARTIDIELYRKLCDMLERVQGEIMRVNMIVDNLNFTGWNTHDVSVKSKWLHEQCEKGDIKGHNINANLG